MVSTLAASTDAALEIPEGICVLTHDPLDVEHVRTLISDDGAGANLIFVGTTRNSFKGNEQAVNLLVSPAKCAQERQ